MQKIISAIRNFPKKYWESYKKELKNIELFGNKFDVVGITFVFFIVIPFIVFFYSFIFIKLIIYFNIYIFLIIAAILYMWHILFLISEKARKENENENSD